jgi:hypothetical protein
MSWGRITIAGIVAAVIVAGCGGRGPDPKPPDRSLMAETVEFADHWEIIRCQYVRLTLRSGMTVDVVQSEISSPDCAPRPPTPLLFGRVGDAMSGVDAGEAWAADDAPLIFIGSDGDGGWLGFAGRDDSCWRVTFGTGEGAWPGDGGSMHLATGPVLRLADGFQLPDSPAEPYPLRAGDSICLDAHGRVLSILIPPIL